MRRYFSDIGRKGGLRSRRTLTGEDARQMVRVREARRAFSRFYSRCFWSCSPAYRIGVDDISFVADMLMRYGGKEGWELGARLCR